MHLIMSGEDIDIGYVIKTSFTSVFHDPGYILLYALPTLVFSVFFVILWYLFGYNMMSFTDQTQMQSIINDNIILVIGLGLTFIILLIVIHVSVIAAVVKKVDAQQKGGKLGIRDALQQGFQLVPRLFASMILFFIIIALPIIALVGLMIAGTISGLFALICLSAGLLVILIIPLIYFSLRLNLFKQSCVLENKGPLDSLKHSWTITKGNVLYIFVILLIIGIIGFVIFLPFMLLNIYFTFSTLFSEGFITSNSSSFNQTGLAFQGFSAMSFIPLIGQIIVQLIIAPVTEIALTLIFLKLTKKTETSTKPLEVSEWPE